MVYRVFISHAWSDRWVAEQIARRARNHAGAETFVSSRDASAGDIVREEVEAHLRTSNELVVLFTPEASRFWVGYELGYGRALRMRIVFIRYRVSVEDVEADHRLGPLEGTFTIDINDIETYYLRGLADRVRALTNV